MSGTREESIEWLLLAINAKLTINEACDYAPPSVTLGLHPRDNALLLRHRGEPAHEVAMRLKRRSDDNPDGVDLGYIKCDPLEVQIRRAAANTVEYAAKHKQLAIQALGVLRSDADVLVLMFSKYTAEQMQETYPSGKTCAEILAEYKAKDAEIAAAIAWLEEV